MTSASRARAPFLAVALGLLVAGACSTEPTFVSANGAGGGAAAGVTGAGGATGAVTGGACTAPTDCPGNENECSARTCVGGQCGLDLKPEGTLVAAQAGGDCKKAICDGQGMVTTSPDDADVPSDGNSCTLDVCSGGEPSHPSAPAGTGCGIGLACNDMGQCAGCTDASQCGVETACTSFQCDPSQICVFEYVPAGQGDPGGQQAGDCYRLTCNGIGGTSTVVDDTDTPFDGNACTEDVCTLGAPSNPPAAADAECGAGFTCDGRGNCQGCTVDTDCGQSSPCATFACVEQTCETTYVPAGQGDPGGQQAGDCQRKVCNGAGGVVAVGDDADLPVDGNVCTNDVCSGGVPSNPNTAANTPCGGNLTCDGMGVCTGCATNADCGAPSACATPVCSAGSCSTEFVPYGLGNPGGQVASDCKKNVCNGSGSAVSIADDGDVIVDGNPCTYDICSGGVPSNPAAGAGTGCPGGVCNGGGSCVQCLSDGDCGSPSACASPQCSGGGCTMNYVPAGQGDPGGQQSGDCRVVRCNGSGGTAQYDDNGDVPNDNNGCTSDSCSNGNPVHTPIGPTDDGNVCTTDVCNPGTGQTDHIPVGNGTGCGDSCSTCQSGVCQSACNGCQECYQGACYPLCFQADCLKCNNQMTGCVPISL